ncbi:MAG: type II toxin-antitoxin system RelE/ParE family toxin [Methylococcales bacterium]|nr:type II toxin-antitoxin system RelE/ParE family toxin [Methylococcales bacterium]MDD5755083.1 type II toxin-antitoxin system RelE/ParE family toxin [Methylococcales bacterium]
MRWQIEYYSEAVEEDILNLPEGLLARYLRLSDLMLEFGANLGMPHTKALHDGLFELRIYVSKRKKALLELFIAPKSIKKLLCYTYS